MCRNNHTNFICALSIWTRVFTGAALKMADKETGCRSSLLEVSFGGLLVVVRELSQEGFYVADHVG